jgi:hypothetical protein
MPPQPVTVQDCQDAAADVCYELRAMAQARDLSAHAKQQTDPKYAESVLVIRNCAIESFLIHYRALREFFSSLPKTNPDNLKATDYLSAWQTSVKWVTEQKEIDRIHKRLAHLSRKRTTLDNNWGLAHMESNVSQTFEDFISKLAPDQQLWFHEATDLIMRRKPTSTVLLGNDSSSTASGGQPIMIFPAFQ